MVRWIAKITACGFLCLASGITLTAGEPTPSLLLVDTSLAPASATGEPDAELTLQQLQELALTHNPTLSQARAETWKARGQYVQSGLKPNPKIGYSAQEIGNDGAAGQQGAFVSQKFITGNKLYLSQQIFALRQHGASWELTSQYYRVENNVRREYYNIVTAQRLLTLTKQVRLIAKNSLDIARARAARGESSKIDQLQAQLELQKALILTRNAEAQYDAAWNRLRSVIGTNSLKTQPVSEDVIEDAPVLEWDSTLARLLDQSPQVQQARFQASSARAAYIRAQVEPIPNVTAQLGTAYDYGSETQIASVQVSMPIPVFNKNQGNVRTAHSEWIRTSREVKRLQLQLARQLADEFKKYVASQAQIGLYRSKMIPASAETLKLSQLAFEAGELNYLQLLTAQRTFAETNIEYVRSNGNLWQSMVAIDGLLLTDGLKAPRESVSGP